MASRTDLIVTGHVGTKEHEWIAFMPDKYELIQGGATEEEAIGRLWLASAGDRIAHLLFPRPGERDETEQIQPMLFHYQFAPDGTIYLESIEGSINILKHSETRTPLREDDYVSASIGHARTTEFQPLRVEVRIYHMTGMTLVLGRNEALELLAFLKRYEQILLDAPDLDPYVRKL